VLQNGSPDHGKLKDTADACFRPLATWASARSMERNGHDKPAHCSARIALRQQAHRDNNYWRLASTSFSACADVAADCCRARSWLRSAAAAPRLIAVHANENASLDRRVCAATTQSELRGANRTLHPRAVRAAGGESEGLLQSDCLSANSGRRLITFPVCRACNGGSAALTQGPGSLLLAARPAR
jgi:hypothetical protein